MRSTSRVVAACTALVLAAVQVAVPASPAPSPAPAPMPKAGQAAPTVVSVSVSGNVHVPSDQILAVVKTKPGQPFDANQVKQDLQAIFALGYFADQVPPLIEQRPGGIAVTFRVVENPVITSIAFTGNTHVPSDTLLALMDTASGQVYNANTFHEDVIRINSYYDKVGYEGQVPSHVANLSIDAKTGVLSIQIREGLTVKDVVIKGDPVLAPTKIEAALATKPGEAYSNDLRDKDYQAIKGLYDKADMSIGDFEEGIDPASVDLTNGTANVIVTLSAARIGAILITGNQRTKDIVIRRQLRDRPGMLLQRKVVNSDYERLQGLQFFDKVSPTIQPGPDPKNPSEVTLVFDVKEKRSATLKLGVGYSGGANGNGLTGDVGFSESNLNGSGNGVGVDYQRGARFASATANYSVPFLGNSPQSEKYSLAASAFSTTEINYYQAYQATTTGNFATPPVISTPAPGSSSTSSTQTGTIPVTLQPNSLGIAGLAATYKTHVEGVGLTLGRRFSLYTGGTWGLNFQRLSNDVSVPLPYYVAGNQPAALTNPNLVFNAFGTSTSGNSLGISAPSIANTMNNILYNLRFTTLGLSTSTEDNNIDPQHGYKASATEEIGLPSLGSYFDYTLSTLDLVKFFPFLKRSTIGLHGEYGTSTGALPSTKLYAFSDQQLRGYSNVFFGTDMILGQAEWRIPLTADRKFGIHLFTDYGALKVRDAAPTTDQFGDVLENYGNFVYHADAGIGTTFTIPGVGLFRLDFAKGKNGTHVSFGIGQSF